MEELDQQLLADILSELQKFNDRYDQELERAENERTIQAIEDSNNAEILAEAEKQALEEQRVQEEQLQEKELAAQNLAAERFEAIESYFEAQNTANEANQLVFEDITIALGNLDPKNQEMSLSEISHKLNALIESTEVSEDQIQEQEVRHFTDLAIIVFLLGFIPCFLAYKGLSKLFDSAFA